MAEELTYGGETLLETKCYKHEDRSSDLGTRINAIWALQSVIPTL